MNNSIYRISLDIHDTSSQTSLSVKKGDTARSIYITLTENGKPYKIAEGCSAVLSGKKADGNYLYNDCKIEGNVIIYDFTEQTVPVVGKVECEITLYDANGKNITSPCFDLIVENRVYNDEEIISSAEANALISATTEAISATDAANTIAEDLKQKHDSGYFNGKDGKDGKDADPNLFANAVIGSASGEVVRVDDVSPVEHNVKVKVDHDNPTSVTVTSCGKNLINLLANKSLTKQADGSVANNDASNLKQIEIYLPVGTYHFSYDLKCPVGNNYRFRLHLKNGSYIEDYKVSTGDFVHFEKSVVVDAPIIAWSLHYSTVITYINGVVIKNFQFEKGEVATDIEEYHGTPYTPNEDGTVEGITSLSPTMTLLTDTEGAVIHCEYNRDTNKALLSGGATVTADGTVVSQNADFAEVAEWADGNPKNEDRTGYFVCANVPLDGIVMKKATSTDDVKGVTILAPAFAGNYSNDKVDSNGNLLPKYSYVAIIGFVPVIDKGRCTVGGRCMPDDDGCAVPSSNSMGYQVVQRIDNNRVLIIIEPNGDMVQRIKTKLQGAIRMWQPNTEYKVGDVCLWSTYLDQSSKTTFLMYCIEKHTSSSSIMGNLQCWQQQNIKVTSAKNDALGNDIVSTYATKEEVGNIETALDNMELPNEITGYFTVKDANGDADVTFSQGQTTGRQGGGTYTITPDGIEFYGFKGWFSLYTNGVEGSDTAKESWKNWLGIVDVETILKKGEAKNSLYQESEKDDTALSLGFTELHSDVKEEASDTYNKIADTGENATSLGTSIARGKRGFTGGSSNLSTGKASITLGADIYNKGDNAAGFGYANAILAAYALCGGSKHILRSQNQTAGGHGNDLTGYCASAFGDGLMANDYGQTVLGAFNKPVLGALLIIGCGTSENDRKNALVLMRDGKMYLRGDTSIYSMDKEIMG